MKCSYFFFQRQFPINCLEHSTNKKPLSAAQTRSRRLLLAYVSSAAALSAANAALSALLLDLLVGVAVARASAYHGGDADGLPVILLSSLGGQNHLEGFFPDQTLLCTFHFN